MSEQNALHLAQMGDVDIDTANRLLHKFNGDMEKAVDALLSGDKGYETTWETPHRTSPEPQYSNGKTTPAAPHTSSSVIDLTGDHDDEYNRALQMSIQDSSSQPQFRRTERAPHPEWQMVVSNVCSLLPLHTANTHRYFRRLLKGPLMTIELFMTLYKLAFRISPKKTTLLLQRSRPEREEGAFTHFFLVIDRSQ